MTQELIDTINGEFDDAIASGDAMRIDKAQVRYAKAMMECQKKTGDRVKQQMERIESFETKMDGFERKLDSVVQTIGSHTQEISELKKTANEFSNMKERGKGAVWAVKLLQALAAGGGLAGIYKLLESFGK